MKKHQQQQERKAETSMVWRLRKSKSLASIPSGFRALAAFIIKSSGPIAGCPCDQISIDKRLMVNSPHPAVAAENMVVVGVCWYGGWLTIRFWFCLLLEWRLWQFKGRETVKWTLPFLLASSPHYTDSICSGHSLRPNFDFIIQSASLIDCLVGRHRP